MFKGTGEHLRDVRALTRASADVGYVQRLRLQRAVLKVHRAVAAEAGLPIPTRLTDRLPVVSHQASLSNQLAESARVICQPSESLDRRWIAEWDLLQDLVTELEAALPLRDPVVQS